MLPVFIFCRSVFSKLSVVQHLSRAFLLFPVFSTHSYFSQSSLHILTCFGFFSTHPTVPLSTYRPHFSKAPKSNASSHPHSRFQCFLSCNDG